MHAQRTETLIDHQTSDNNAPNPSRRAGRQGNGQAIPKNRFSGIGDRGRWQQIMQIRTATQQDRDRIRRLHFSAFAEGEREMVSQLAVSLLSEETTPEIISLVAETEGAVVGHVAFSPVTIDSNEDLQGYLLAPLGVQPEYQHRRIGSQLIESGMRRLSALGVDLLFVYGDPKYYGRFGFRADVAGPYIPPYKLQYPFGWQAIALKKCRAEKVPVPIDCVASLRDPTLW